jgi:hypothetical protein
MQPMSTLGDPPLCPIDRIVIERDRIIDVAERKAHRPSIEDIHPCI